VAAKLTPTCGGHWRVHYPCPEPPPLVTLIIPTRNRRELLVACVESVFAKTVYPNFEVLIADNDSDDPELLAYYCRMKERKDFDVLSCPGPFNFSAINNRAVQQARGAIIGLLNNDLEIIDAGWLGEMVSHAVRPGIGAVGARLYYPDFSIQHAGVITGLGGVAGHAFKGFSRHEPGMQFRPHLAQNLSAVTAACLVICKSTYLKVGGLDDKCLTVAFNDVDFCLKVQALGLRNLYTPFAELIHHESASRGAEHTPEKIRRFQGEIAAIKARWGDRLLSDPAYNPNLSLDTEDFALAYPPRVPPLGGPAN
jgi:GT2 family glycosyltransferase